MWWRILGRGRLGRSGTEMLVLVLSIKGETIEQLYVGERFYSSMGALTPFPHSIKHRFVIVNDDVNALRLERLHLRVGDVAADLKDHIVLVVEAGHLSTRVSSQISLCAFLIYIGERMSMRPHNQSIQAGRLNEIASSNLRSGVVDARLVLVCCRILKCG